MDTRTPHFDPNHLGHKTAREWAQVGRYPWFVNAVLWSMGAGEARILLRCGAVLRVTFTPPGPFVVEELP